MNHTPLMKGGHNHVGGVLPIPCLIRCAGPVVYYQGKSVWNWVSEVFEDVCAPLGEREGRRTWPVYLQQSLGLLSSWGADDNRTTLNVALNSRVHFSHTARNHPLWGRRHDTYIYVPHNLRIKRSRDCANIVRNLLPNAHVQTPSRGFERSY